MNNSTLTPAKSSISGRGSCSRGTTYEPVLVVIVSLFLKWNNKSKFISKHMDGFLRQFPLSTALHGINGWNGAILNETRLNQSVHILQVIDPFEKFSDSCQLAHRHVFICSRANFVTHVSWLQNLVFQPDLGCLTAAVNMLKIFSSCFKNEVRWVG